MASVAESLFADDARGRRKKKKRGASSKQIDAVVSSSTNDGGGAVGDWQPFTSPDGRTYYYNQVTRESRWKLPRALREAQCHVKGHSGGGGGKDDEVAPTLAKKVAGDMEPARAKSTPNKPQEKEKAKENGSKPISARGDIVARLQASLAGRINPMGGGGPPPMIQIPRGPVAEAAALSSADAGGDGIFSSPSAAGVFGGELPEGEFDAETAGMTPAERLRFIRRKRQESMFKKEKIVEQDDFMKEFARNMEKKEAERVQRMTPEDIAREKIEAERKKEEAEAKKKRDEDAQRKKREEEEEQERERQQQREEDQRRRREEEKKARIEAEREREREREREAQRLRGEAEEREEQAKRAREKEEVAQHEREEQERLREQRRDSDSVPDLVRQRSRATSTSSAVSASISLFGESSGGHENAVESSETRARRRTRSTGSKTFAAEAVEYSETHPSRPSSRRNVKQIDEQQQDGPTVEADTPPTSSSSSPFHGEDGPTPIDGVVESLEGVQLDETQEETPEERAARKERRRKKKERRRREQAAAEAEAAAAVNDEHSSASPPSSTNSAASPQCQCAACVHGAAHVGHMPPPHSPYHHHPPPSPGSTQYPHGAYPYYPPGYPPPPPPFYPPPMYGYGVPPPFLPMYAPPPPPPPMMFPPGMAQMPMMMMVPPLSGGGMMMAMGDGGANGAIIANSPYAAYLPPVLSRCESCRGRGVGLAEKNGLCAHCNRLRLDFIVASAQIKRRCAVCGGWGLGLVQSDGRCAHCTRVADATAARSSTTTASAAPVVEWDASSSSDGNGDDDSDWDE